jgi:hypothetical protein
VAQSPSLFYFPLLTPLAPFLNPPYLLENPPFCDRISSTLVSGYSQTDLPFLNPFPFPPRPKFPVPRLIMRLTTTTSRIRLLLSGTPPFPNFFYELHFFTFYVLVFFLTFLLTFFYVVTFLQICLLFLILLFLLSFLPFLFSLKRDTLIIFYVVIFMFLLFIFVILFFIFVIVSSFFVFLET